MSKITDISIQKRNKKRVNVFVDGEYLFACDCGIVYKYNLKINEEIDCEKFQEITKEDNFIKCKNSALNIIERTHKTEKEVKDKLFLKGYDETSVDNVIQFLKEYDLINDEKYINMYIKDRIKNEGKNKIKFALIKKGIPKDTIEEKLDGFNPPEELEGLRKMCQKKYNTLIKKESDKYIISQKLFRFLASKGYSFQSINSVIKEIIHDTYDYME